MIPGFVVCRSLDSLYLTQMMSKPCVDILARIKNLLNATGSVLDFIKTLCCVKC